MKEDCFEISFKDGCDKPVYFVQTMRYPDISLHRSYIENWWFYPSTKKVDGNSYYVYKNKKTRNIFNVNINIVVSEIMKKVSNDSIICFF